MDTLGCITDIRLADYQSRSTVPCHRITTARPPVDDDPDRNPDLFLWFAYLG